MPQQGQRMDMVRDDDVGGNDGMGFNAAVTGEFIRNQSRRGVSWWLGSGLSDSVWSYRIW